MSNLARTSAAPETLRPPGSGPTPETATLLATGVGLGVTALVAATPWLPFGYENPAAHTVLETADTCAAMLAAYLLYGRWLRSHRRQDLLLLQGLILVATAGLVLTALRLAGGDGPGTWDVWLPLALRTAGIVCIVAAALAGDVVARTSPRRWEASAAVVGVVAVLLVLGAVESWLPVALDPEVAPPSASAPALVGHPVLLGAQLATFVCYALAAALFTMQARRRDDVFMLWLGPACALAGVARLNYFLYPSVYSDWLYVGDILRFASYIVLTVGAASEIRRYWAAHAQLAVSADRRRLARELHDGVVQELGYIRAESTRFTAFDAARAQRVLSSCDRALDEARQAVHALGHVGDARLDLTLRTAAQRVAERHHVALDFVGDASVSADRDATHALVRIVAEAVGNAARHARADRVRVLVSGDGRSGRLVICDDGVGFDPAQVMADPTGFGLTSMRQRSESLPGSFRVDSAPSAGTRITVTW